MSVKLNKEHLCLNSAVCSRYMQTTVESDIIVPDIKPDILKVLQAHSEVAITRREVQGDKVFVQGIVRMNVLYVPENGLDGSIKSISANQEFNHSMDISGAALGMELFVDAETAPAEYTLVNSRKLKVKTRVSLAARLMSASEMDIATGVCEDCSIEVKCKPTRLYNPCVDVLRDILIRERLEVPGDKPPISEVLKISAKPCSIELKSLSGKAMAKGELKISTLYCGESESCMPEVMEHTLPFSELLEIDGLCEGMEAEVDYCLKDIYFEICQDNDGDRKILSIEATVEAEVRAFDVIECSILEDAYCHNHPLTIKKEAVALEQLVSSCTNQTTVKETVDVPDYLPEVYRLCECFAVPSIESVSVENGHITVNGFLQCSFLYLSREGTTPASGFAHVIPFCQELDITGANQSSVCDAKADAEHISCNITSGKSLEVRAIVSVSLKVVETASGEIISEIVCDESQTLPKAPSMSVYFVQKGDSLWDIAKKYRTSPDNILSVNGGSADNIVPGKCIYIFK